MHVHDPQPYDGRTTEITSQIQGRSDQDLAISANQVLQIQQQRHPFVAGGTAPVLGRFYDVTTTDATSQPLAAVSNTAASAEVMVAADAKETDGAAGSADESVNPAESAEGCMYLCMYVWRQGDGCDQPASGSCVEHG